jgi:hypothetical protein
MRVIREDRRWWEHRDVHRCGVEIREGYKEEYRQYTQALWLYLLLACTLFLMNVRMRTMEVALNSCLYPLRLFTLRHLPDPANSAKFNRV